MSSCHTGLLSLKGVWLNPRAVCGYAICCSKLAAASRLTTWNTQTATEACRVVIAKAIGVPAPHHHTGKTSQNEQSGHALPDAPLQAIPYVVTNQDRTCCILSLTIPDVCSS